MGMFGMIGGMMASMEEQLGCQRLRSTTHVWLGSVVGYDECCRWRMMRYKGMDGPTNWSGRDIFRWLTSDNCSFTSRQTLYSYSSTSTLLYYMQNKGGDRQYGCTEWSRKATGSGCEKGQPGETNMTRQRDIRCGRGITGSRMRVFAQI